MLCAQLGFEAIPVHHSSMNIKQRGKIYQLVKRVPRRYQPVEARETVWISLHTDSESVAKAKAPMAWAQMIEAWEARLAGDSTDAESRFEAAKELAAVRGFRYMPAARVAKLERHELLQRVEAVQTLGNELHLIEAAAVLGTIAEPPIKVSRALELFWTLAKAKTLGKSEAQVKKWKSPIKQAIRDFIAVVGDKAIGEISRDDVRAFRDWWLERIETEDLNPTTVNKNMDHFGKVLKLVNEEKRLGLTLPLGGLRLEEGEKNTRPPFSLDWIKNKLLKRGALDGLDAEARAVLLVMVNTGARPSEICALTASTINLSSNVPYISIEPDGRKLKTKHARRKIPLVGVSLEALRAFPDGFPRYRESEGLSKAISDYLTANGLRETAAHSLYSLRHSFEDRMLKVGVDERIRRDLMGHRLTRERYGEGADLEHLHTLIQAIAL
ncbi:tyrosine-type recombinase/integrase [Cypionkella psychrotolerans]|uniref:tyrosine-type recombinase/integrase n=1 Tax=Cypionkella psychrotolerans TaxID=1678131 RepID=UPI002E249D2A|nr:tyrosine-type recombinase/integrase [Cypionkella psychrotolerans]